jgi:L-alanine-DL-glutamate epimerase-like enolase superfamily enzyme
MKHLREVLLGENCFNLAEIHRKMDRAIDGNTAAKAAVDIALHDAWGKSLGVPVRDLLGGTVRKEIPLAWSVGLQDFESSVEEAKERFAEGYKVIKVKVGKDLDKDARLVTRLRELFGAEVPLRLDANQGYSPIDAVTLLRRLDACSLESFEQPVRKWDLEGMRYVREHSGGVPIMADESVSSLFDAGKVIRLGVADLVNIKVGKVGGLYRACQIAALVEAAGLRAAAGSNLELGIGEAASVHFVASQGALSVPCDLLCGTELHARNVIVRPLSVENGLIRCPDEPGLGVEVDEALFA